MTTRLVLRRYIDADEANMVALLTDESVKETFMIPDFHSYEEAATMFRKLMAYSLTDEHYERGICRDGELIGFLNDVEIEGKRIELGYVISPKHKNNGYATEALRAAIGELFCMGYDTVETAAFTENMASRRVMEKCGMTLTDKTSSVDYHGKTHACVHYVIKKDE